MIITNWLDTTVIALKSLWIGFIDFIPNLIGALLIFIIGWVIAVAVGKLVAEVLKKIRFNQIFEKGAWKTALEKAEIKVDAAAFIGAIVKWVLLIAFLIAALQILGLSQLKDFFVDVLNYLPNVVVASFILVIAIIIADILEKVVRATIEGVKVGYGQLIGAIIKWSIWIFAILAIMLQLGIAEDLVKTIIQGVVALIVIAGGLAFGLGGKEVAADILQNLRNKLSR
ncbi:MAG: hypothetical protein A2V72_00255 [Candidatus Nealsonbacteria bacterium RBG_13_37_56]|uniref:Small-conductance mechanosensitive ion channel n=1 Tax=Candidatus Nealsonbacteria bacterium RBG_13_37_56 TaxID=1801661 RepID=A0A1G2DUV1_9BACT|nr:MAG: hypothetical protein A2V72_00255 [Candidatus Nealsonbacteria bacterium RBG_13_37_56]